MAIEQNQNQPGKPEKVKDSQEYDIDELYIQLENKCISEIPLICEQYNIKCEDNYIRPRNWEFILGRLYKEFIKPNSIVLLKYSQENNRYNKYDISKVERLYTLYTELSKLYNQVSKLKHFIVFSGIDHQSIYNWSCDLSPESFAFVKMIKSDNEEALEDLLLDKSLNPMKVLPILNYRHGWDKGGRSETTNGNCIELQELPKFPEIGVKMDSENSEN